MCSILSVLTGHEIVCLMGKKYPLRNKAKVQVRIPYNNNKYMYLVV